MPLASCNADDKQRLVQGTDLVLFCKLESKVFACAVFSDTVDDQVSCVKGEFCCAILLDGDMHLRAHSGSALKTRSNISSMCCATDLCYSSNSLAVEVDRQICTQRSTSAAHDEQALASILVT